MTWTDEKITELLKLYAQGLSHAEIGRALGCGSRLEVTGKLWRIQKRKRQPGTNMGRPIGGGKPEVKPERSGGDKWERETFAPYAVWKAERRKERELGLR